MKKLIGGGLLALAVLAAWSAAAPLVVHRRCRL